MGGAQAIAALAYGTETVASRRRDRRARKPLRAGGQAPAVRDSVGIDSFAGPSDLLAIADPITRSSRSHSICSHRPSMAPERSWSASPPIAELARGTVGATRPRPARIREAVCRLVLVPSLELRAGAGRGVRARAPGVARPAGRATGPTCHPRRLRVRRDRNRVRRLHRGLKPHACRPEAPRGSPRRSGRSTSAACSPRCASRMPTRWPAPPLRWPAPRASSSTRSRWRSGSGQSEP